MSFTSFAKAVHKARHAIGGADPLTPADIGAEPAGAVATQHAADDLSYVSATASSTISGLKDFTTPPTLNGVVIGTGGIVDASQLTGVLADAQMPPSSGAAMVASKAPLASPAFTGVPTGLTKIHVGLGSVDNTADAAKPVSALQAAADTVAKARANHTGTQLAATISDLAAAVSLLSPVSNTFFSSGPLTVLTGSSRWYNPTSRTLTLVSARASVNTAPTGLSVIIDIIKGGVSIFGTIANRPTITAGTFTALAGAATVTTLGVGEYLTVDVDQVGSGVAGSDMTLSVVYA